MKPKSEIIKDQEQWQEWRRNLGDESARELLVLKLRNLADHIESGKWPRIFSCSIDELEEKDLMYDFHVVLSYPWPG